MLNYGSVAVAMVHSQVMVVQGILSTSACCLTRFADQSIDRPAARPHDLRDRYLDVYTFAPFNDRVFLASSAPCARIASHDLLTIFPVSDVFRMPAQDILELPEKAFVEFTELSSRNQKRYESLWTAMKAKTMKAKSR